MLEEKITVAGSAPARSAVAPAAAREDAITARDVSKRYGAHWAVSRATFRVAQGSCFLIIGQNGAGKSTLLRIVATLNRPTLGELSYFGEAPRHDHAAVRHRIGLLSPRLGLYEDLTAAESLLTFGRLSTRPSSDRIHELLGLVGLNPSLATPVRLFSQGMRKRLALACLAAQDPDLVLLDEPYGALDPAGMTLVDNMVRRWQRQGATVVIATHHVERGAELADDGISLDRGRIVAKGSAEELTRFAAARFH
ncbi:MAG: ABC transporter ATP-binding protein [Candidatus Schekmanbacteria bacterium]|nr:ABC transporter ATP-binding protein [Candidatus Schekmanbacteria bacterium]